MNMEFTTTTISIIREHDKICLLEKILKENNLEHMETLISNLIDCMIENKQCCIDSHINNLQSKLHNEKKLRLIIELCESIAQQMPFSLTIEINEFTKKYINYINNNQFNLQLF